MKSRQRTMNQVLEAILGLLRQRTEEPERNLAESYARRFFAHVEVEDLEGMETADLCGAVLCHFRLGRARQPRRASVRIYNPTQQEHGWSSDHTVIEMVNDDMPFLVDSVTGELARRDLAVHFMVHPQLGVRRDSDGRLQEIAAEGDRESLIHLQVDQLTQKAPLVELETALCKILDEVRLAVDDWPLMRRAAEHLLSEFDAQPPPVPAAEVAETRAFLVWVTADHFTFLGYREYRLASDGEQRFLRPVAESGLGVRRHVSLEARARSEQPLGQLAARFLDSDRLVMVSKSNHPATVHRPVHMDVISLKRFAADGQLIGEYRMLGLFTSMAYAIPSGEIPLVRLKAARVIERAALPPASHDAKLLKHVVEFYPRDELFQISEDDLYHFARRILRLHLRPRVILLVRYDELERFASSIVYVPRDQHSTELRRRIGKILEQAFAGEQASFSARISELPLAQLHYTFRLPSGPLPEIDLPSLEARLLEAARSWSDRLRARLVGAGGEEGGLGVFRRYGMAFSASYQEHSSPEVALEDIAVIEQVLGRGQLGLRLYRRPGAVASRLRLRTFELAVPRPLADFLPLLENLGLKVLAEIPFEVRPTGAVNPVWVRDFELVIAGQEVDLEDCQHRFVATFSRLWSGEIESDGLNRLVLGTGLNWRQVLVLRAYVLYLQQANLPFSRVYMAQTLFRNGEVTRGLVDLFETLFDPDRQQSAKQLAEQLEQQLWAALDRVFSLDEDRILRALIGVVAATLRTNFYQFAEDGGPKSYLSLKLAARRIAELPEPRPEFEIFVYSPAVEAVHLRGGLVARGGVRWSDRPADFRTEVLGLIKAQIVKNAVIVPVGAKGGFVVKRPPASGGREELLAEGKRCYRTMIRGLLDLTDNRRGERIETPPRLVCRDAPDPYLVVAADKGTAAFSDLANEIAREYDFWLGDAFASGGSVGYDHKAMGITARGAWESVKRHFRELDHNIQKQPFTAIGVGDMSGDVFGNGMLLSEHTCLLAAFNHLQIFVDPDPDPQPSYAERQRLFRLPRSTWSDYQRGALSAGGAVFERSAKRLELSPEVQRMLGLSETRLTPNDLISAILRCSVDLLWFGGIGTYVKARQETDTEVGDRANDSVRIDASELRCRVIGEGANLGLTQAGRIEYAMGGGCINTDFIDNSGGVDTSDHEVNIKIALDLAMAEGQLDQAARDQLLAEMSEEVVALVLRDNYLQSQALTLSIAQGAELLAEQRHFLLQLERAGRLDRRLERLPDEASLAEREEQQRGLTRPEAAVLLAYAKIYVYEELLSSDLPDDPQLVGDLLRYFPQPVAKRFRGFAERHRLRREIIATSITNSMLNRVGPTFVERLRGDTGFPVPDIARAYTAARDAFRIRRLWGAIEKLDNRVPAELQAELFLHSIRLIERATRWFLRYGDSPREVSKHVAAYRAAIGELADNLEDLLPARARAEVRRRRKRFETAKVPRRLSQQISALDYLACCGDIVRIGRAADEEFERVGKIYFLLGERLGLDRIRRWAARADPKSRWRRQVLKAMGLDLFHHQADLTRRAVSEAARRPRSAVEGFLARHPQAIERLAGLVGELRPNIKPDVAMLSLLEREVRRICGGW